MFELAPFLLAASVDDFVVLLFSIPLAVTMGFTTLLSASFSSFQA